ncbi:MAG: nitrate reductase associated protein, partial [Ginsengibacter sp.]
MKETEEIIEYFSYPPLVDKGSFKFEEDFVEEGVRCIPMVVRFKLDACGIKLKLSEWSTLIFEERKQ